MGQNHNLGAELPGGDVVVLGGIESNIVIVHSVNPATRVHLGTSNSGIVESDICVEVIWDLIGSLVWDAIDKSGCQMLWRSPPDGQVDNGSVAGGLSCLKRSAERQSGM